MSSVADLLEQRLGGTFALTEGALLVVVRGPVHAAPEVARWLRSREPEAVLCPRLSDVFVLPVGATAFAPFEAEDGPLLNERRPSLARNQLRLVLWIDRDRDLDALRTDAQDTWTWRSAFVEFPEVEAEPSFVREAVASALRGPAWAVSGDLLVDLRVDAEQPFADLLAAVRSAPAGARVAWDRVTDTAGCWRARWVHTLVPDRLPVLPSALRIPGVVLIDPRPVRYAEACRRLAGSSDPGTVAVAVDLDPQRMTASSAGGVARAPELAWTGCAARAGMWDLPLPNERPWQRTAADALQVVSSPARFSLDPVPEAPWQAAEALRQRAWGLAASTVADLGDLDAALHILTLDPDLNTLDHHFFAGCVLAMLDRREAERHRDALPNHSPEQRFVSALLLGMDDFDAAKRLMDALSAEVEVVGRWGGGLAGRVEQATTRSDLVAVFHDAMEIFGTNPQRLGVAKAILYALHEGRIDEADSLLATGHLEMSPHPITLHARAALAAARLRHGEVLRLTELTLAAVDQLAPGRFHPLRVVSALQRAAALRWTGEPGRAESTLKIARAYPFPQTSEAERQAWLVDVFEADLAGRAPDESVVRSGLERWPDRPDVYSVAERFVAQHPENTVVPTLATRQALRLAGRPSNSAVALALHLATGAVTSRQSGAGQVVRDALALAERAEDVSRAAQLLVLLAHVEPESAVRHLRRALTLDDTPEVKLSLASALVPSDPGEALALALAAEREAVGGGRDDLGAVGAFTAARCRTHPRQIADDLQRALLRQASMPHPTLVAVDALPVWHDLLTVVTDEDRMRAKWLVASLIRAVPHEDRPAWDSALSSLSRK